MIIFVYAALIFLVLRFSVTLFNFLSNPKLGHYGKHYNEKVSIVLCNAGGDSSETELAIRQQDYENTEVLIQARAETLSSIVNRATGRYLLFLTDEVSVGKGLINNLICRVKTYDLALLSILPNRKLASFQDLCCCPLYDFVQMNILPLRLVLLSDQPAFSVPSQVCMFFNTEIYKAHLNDNVSRTTLGTEVMKQLKQMGYKTEVLQANRFVHLKQHYENSSPGKDLLNIFGNNIYAALIYLLLLMAGPIVMAVNFEPAFLALPFGLIFLARMMISFLTGQNPVVNILLHPLQMLAMVVIMLKVIFDRVLTQVRYKN